MNEYVAASVQRIQDWCEANEVEIPDIAWVAINNELKTMFEAGLEQKVR